MSPVPQTSSKDPAADREMIMDAYGNMRPLPPKADDPWKGSVAATRKFAQDRRETIYRDWMHADQANGGASDEIKADFKARQAIPNMADRRAELFKAQVEHFEILEKLHPDLNTFIAYPKEHKLRQVPTGLPRLQWNPEKGRNELNRNVAKIEVIPAGISLLRSNFSENVYDNVNNKVFNINAPEGAIRHLPDKLFIEYANMARERTKDFSKHPLHGAIKKRAQKILTQREESVQWEKAKAVGRGAAPVKPDFLSLLNFSLSSFPLTGALWHGSPEEELRGHMEGSMESKELHNLMGLAGHGVEGWELTGTITGILASSVYAYSQLAKHGLTKFFGQSNKQKVKWFAAQGVVEALLDTSYNPEAYTMMMGLLTGEDQNRLLSVLDAMVVGTAFNLTADSWRLLTNLTPRQANIALQRLTDDATARQLKKLGVIAYSKHLGETPATAQAQVKVPAIVNKWGRPTNELVKEGLIESEKKGWLQWHDIDEGIKLLEEELKHGQGSTPRAHVKNAKEKKHTLDILKRKRQEYADDASLLSPSEDLLAKQRALLAMDEAVGDSASVRKQFEAMGYTGDDKVLRLTDDLAKEILPEDSLITPGLLEEKAGTLPQQVSRTTLRNSFSKFMQSGDLADMDWSDLGVYLGFGAATGATIAATTNDEKRLAGFMMGFGLPLGVYHKMKSLPLTLLKSRPSRYIAKKYLDYIPEHPITKGLAALLSPLRSRIHRISPYVRQGIDQSEMLSTIRTTQYIERMHIFFGRINEYVRTGVITTAEKDELYWRLRNGKVNTIKKTQSSGKQIRERWLREGEAIGDPAAVEELSAVGLMDEFDMRLDDPAMRGATRAAFEQYEIVLREIGDLLDNHGLINGKIKNYFPRSLKEGGHAKLLKEKGVQEDPVIKELWEAERIRMGYVSVTQLSQYDKAVIADMYIRGHGLGSHKPGFAKSRKWGEVPPEWEHLYEGFETSNLKYVSQMMDYAHNSELLGVGLTKSNVRKVIDKVATKQHIDQVTEQAKREAQGKVTLGKMKPAEAEQYIKDRVAEARAVVIKKTKGTSETEGVYDYMNSIGDRVATWVEEGHVSKKKAEHLKKLLHDRYARPSGRRMNTAFKWGRDISYMWSIGNIYSAMTQITDTAITGSLGSRGPGVLQLNPVKGWMEDTVWGTAAKHLTRGRKVREYPEGLKAFGLDDKDMRRIAAEFEDEAFTTNLLRMNLKAVGFSYADTFGKEALIDATYKELRRAALSRDTPGSAFYQRLEAEYKTAYGKDFEPFVKALRSGRKYDDNVMGAIYGRMLDQYPITKNAMPMVYARHPNARVMYQLASFTIKQIDLLRKRSLDQLAEGVARSDEIGDRMIKDAFYDTFRYTVLFGTGTMGVSATKDFMLGREVDISEYKVNMALNLFGMHRVHVERWRKWAKGDWRGMNMLERTLHATGKTFIPPMLQMGGEVWQDVSKASSGEIPRESNMGYKLKMLGVDTGYTDKDLPYSAAGSWRYLPIWGRTLFWRLGKGKMWEEKRRREKQLIPDRPLKEKIPRLKESEYMEEVPRIK